MGKKHKRHHKLEKDASEDGDESQQEKPSSLKLVLKVGAAPQTPSDVTTADSQSEACDSDTATSDRTPSRSKRRHQEDKPGHQDKKKLQDDPDDDSEDGEDDELPSKEHVFESYDVDESRVRNLREKRPTFATDDDKSALQNCLEYLQKILQRKDQNGFFAFPVTENIAPGYYSVITHPMDFSTMKSKIENGQYRSVAEYKADYMRMMENCMQYNHNETVYHREAKRLLGVGLKHMSRDQVLQLKRNLPSMSGLTVDEIGHLDDDSSDAATGGSDSRYKLPRERTTPRRQALSRFEAIPDKMSPDEILRQAQEAANAAADKLALRAPNSKIGFLRRRDDGSTSLRILNPDNTGFVSEKERIVSLGELVGKLTSGTGSLTGLKEDRRNKVNPVNYLSYGVFSSYAPIYDSSSSNLNKEDSDLLLTTYGDEIGLQYAKSLKHFVADAGDYAVHMVDNLLDILTDHEHSKTNAILLQKERERMRLEQEEAKKKQEMEAAAAHSQVNDISDERSVAECESQRRLDSLSALINELNRMQNARLSRQLPLHLSQVPGPSHQETELANKVAAELSKIVKQVAPSQVAALQAIRSAMGVESKTTMSSGEETAQSKQHGQLDDDGLQGMFEQENTSIEEQSAMDTSTIVTLTDDGTE